MAATRQTFRRLMLDDPEGRWELFDGQLREKPSMSFRHNNGMTLLGRQLMLQLDPNEFLVRINTGRVRREETTYFIPDVFVFPLAYVGPERDRPDALEIYDQPLPLVVEVWSPSTGGYDVDTKFAEYMRRGDVEIWRLHPFERTLTVWRRQPDGSYAEAIYGGGAIEPTALPGVSIDLEPLFV